MPWPRDALNENTHVNVRLPKSFGEYCRSCWTAVGAVFALCYPCFNLLVGIFLVLLFISIVCSFWWILVICNCLKSPGLALDAVSIHNMTVYQNSTTGDGSGAWQVRSDINVNLTMRNRNTVSGCYSTCRRVIVSVYFKDQLLLTQDVPLGFKLKPTKKRPVVLGLQGDGYVVRRDLASLLQVELRNGSAVELNFYFQTRYLRNDHKAGWKHMSCDVITTTPENSLGTTADLLYQSCVLA